MVLPLTVHSENDFYTNYTDNQAFYSCHTQSCTAQRSLYSIRYALSGAEHCLIDKERYKIKEDQYLIINHGSEVVCLPASTGKVLLIILEPRMMIDVFRNLRQKDKQLLANPFEFGNDLPSFFEQVMKVNSDPLGRVLVKFHQNLQQRRRARGMRAIEPDWFYQLTEALILSQQESLLRLKRVKSKKYSTRKELYRRVLKGRTFIRDNWNNPICLEDIARVASMSPYHFHRTFSTVFGLPPLQYSRKIKMAKAADLLKAGNNSVKDIAALLGFSDGFAFSKSFKRELGVSPVRFAKEGS